MFKKIINFIKYNSMVMAIVAVAFVAVASAIAANEDVRDKVIGEEIVETQGVDNSLLLATDLEDFDLGMKITNVMEDAENYYIDYQFNTLGIQDNVWQEIFNQSQLVVSIEALEGGDLGLYIMEELGEVIDYQLAYLKEVQENEEEKGETLIVETTIYTGLIGLVLDTKTKELPGYEPVVKPPVAEETQDDLPVEQAGSTQSMEPTDSDETPDDYLEDSYYYEWLIGNCLSNSGYWYNSTCNAEPEITDDDAPHPDPLPLGEGDDNTPVCDADNLTLCDTQDLCEGAGLYWYDNNDDGNEVCNIEEETTEEAAEEDPMEEPHHPDSLPLGEGDDEDDPEASTFICDADHPTLCDAQEICEDMGLYWYEGECHLEEEVIDKI
jgi:hypothetical protein